MVKTIATLALVIIQIGLMLGNYWFTFGLWPRSWGAFVGFAASTILVAGLGDVVRRSPTP